MHEASAFKELRNLLAQFNSGFSLYYLENLFVPVKSAEWFEVWFKKFSYFYWYYNCIIYCCLPRKFLHHQTQRKDIFTHSSNHTSEQAFSPDLDRNGMSVVDLYRRRFISTRLIDSSIRSSILWIMQFMRLYNHILFIPEPIRKRCWSRYRNIKTSQSMLIRCLVNVH